MEGGPSQVDGSPAPDVPTGDSGSIANQAGLGKIPERQEFPGSTGGLVVWQGTWGSATASGGSASSLNPASSAQVCL